MEDRVHPVAMVEVLELLTASNVEDGVKVVVRMVVEVVPVKIGVTAALV